MNELTKRLTALFALFWAIALAAGCDRPSEEPPPLQGARIGGPFTLVSQDGRSVSDRDFAGRYRLIYFGYSYCPDVCPVDLLHIGQGLTQFEKANPERGSRVQPIFISVDPERDTPAVLRSYVAAFHPRLIGLTGTPEQMREVTKAYGVYYAKQESEGASEYLMDHSRQSVLFGPEGEPIAMIPQDEGATAVAEALDKWVK